MEKKDYTGICTWSLILGITAFFCNPLYLMPIAAIVLGIVGIVNGGSRKGLAIAGLICGLVAIPVQIFLDTFAGTFVTLITGGVGIIVAWLPWVI